MYCKSIINCCLIIATIFCVAASSAEDKIITVTGMLRYPVPPYVWSSCAKSEEESHPQGTVAAVLDRFFATTDYQLKYLPSTSVDVGWDGHVAAVEAGLADAVMVMPKWAAANKRIITSAQPVIEMKNAIVYRDDFAIKSIEGFQGYTGFFATGDQGDDNKDMERLTSQYGLQLKPIFSTKESIEKLKLGDIDYIVLDYYHGRIQTLSQKDPQQYKFFVIPDNVRTMYFALRDTPDNKDIMVKLDEFLLEARESKLIEYINQSNLRAWLNRSDCS